MEAERINQIASRLNDLQARSAELRNGSLTTGPTPGVTSTPKPMAWAGTTMSL